MNQVCKTKTNSQNRAFKSFINRRFSKAVQQRIVLQLRHNDRPIKAFRIEWKIPKGGFVSLDESRDWWKNLNTIVPEKIRDVEYLELENYYLLRRFTFVDVIRCGDHEEFPRVTKIKGSAQAVFDQELKKLLLKFHLDPDFHLPVRDYIVLGKAGFDSIENTCILVSERITMIPNFGEVERKISLNVGINNDEQDLRDIYRFFAKSLQQTINGHLRGLSKNQKEFERNLKILVLHNDGKNPKEIADALAEERIHLDWSYIRKIINRIKKY